MVRLCYQFIRSDRLIILPLRLIFDERLIATRDICLEDIHQNIMRSFASGVDLAYIYKRITFLKEQLLTSDLNVI